MNEKYLGSKENQRYIRAYLSNTRKLDPFEIVTVSNPIRLDEEVRLRESLDMRLLRRVIKGGINYISRHYSVALQPLSPSRYYTASPAGVESVGGFHDPRSVGYQYWYRAGFVMLLRHQDISREIRTLEFARSYLHDCLHAETFVSFRRADLGLAASVTRAKRRVPEIYREQYGINFRNQDGVSYSSTRLTSRVPEAINLNLLMDGLITFVVAQSLKNIMALALGQTKIERKVLAEMSLQDQRAGWGRGYFVSVVNPTQRFIEYWGGTAFARLLLQAMISGKLADVKGYFEAKTGIPNAWEKRFRRHGFFLPAS